MTLSKLYKIRLHAGAEKPSLHPDTDIENTWRKLDELLASLLTIHEMGMTSTGPVTIEDFCNAALDNACDLMSAKRGSVMMYDDSSRELKIVASKGISSDVLEHTRLKPGEGIAGKAFETGENIFIPNPEENSQYAGYRAAPDQQEPFISIPLKAKDKQLGVLNLHSSDSTKPFTDYNLKFLSILAGETAITLENLKLYESLQEFYLEMVQTLARTIDAKDSYTHDHAGRARRKASRIARELKLPEQMVRYVEYAALQHDIGKIGINESIHLKSGRLSQEEYAVMKKHPGIGYQILAPVRFLGPVAQMVLYHQEWFNGNGYPEGLKGDEIPLGARIVAAIDAWDAMTSDRPYRKALSREKALDELKRGSGTQFDPKVVEAFILVENQEWKMETSETAA
ncbi:MAG: GAF domain-containing protein [Deltaproteobacteria bacterium]|nr:GAF domain-containing protein [Deltaproteobacteria bacterium]